MTAQQYTDPLIGERGVVTGAALGSGGREHVQTTYAASECVLDRVRPPAERQA